MENEQLSSHEMLFIVLSDHGAIRFHPMSSLNFAFNDAKNGNSVEKEFFIYAFGNGMFVERNIS
jgi:hypothetical protein